MRYGLLTGYDTNHDRSVERRSGDDRSAQHRRKETHSSMAYDGQGRLIGESINEQDIYGATLDITKPKPMTALGRIGSTANETTSRRRRHHDRRRAADIQYTARGDQASYTDTSTSSDQPDVVTTTQWTAVGGDWDGYNTLGLLAGFHQVETRVGDTLDETIETDRSNIVLHDRRTNDSPANNAPTTKRPSTARARTCARTHIGNWRPMD